MAQLIEYFNQPQSWDNTIQSSLIDQFIAGYSQIYDFQDSVYQNLMTIIIDQRLCKKEWLHKANTVNVLKILQVVRLLTRDKEIFSVIKNSEYMLEILNEMLCDTSSKLSTVQPNDDNSTISITLEIVSIIKRFIGFYDHLLELFKAKKVFSNIIDLISANQPLIIQTLLQFLFYFFDSVKMPTELKESFVNELGQIFYIGKLLFICQQYDESFQIQSINLLTRLLDFKIIGENFRRIHGISTLMFELKQTTTNLNLRISILNCMYQLLQKKTESVYDFQVFGIIPILQSLLKTGRSFMEISLSVNILSVLIMDDDLSVKILDSGLQSVTRFLLDFHPINREKKEQIQFQDIKPETMSEAIFQLQLHCFRLLRFLFSIEKNRQIFQLLFPPRLFGIFIDIGNYVQPFSKYQSLTEQFNLLSKSDIDGIQMNLEQIKKENYINSGNSPNLKSFSNYMILEMIGKGAFGTVYLVKKGENKYALKHIPFNNLDVKLGEINEKNLDQYFKEVQIYKNLKHPNIVTYYESFIEEKQGALCIVMEFVEGFNLSELIKIQTEKGSPFQEKQIWKFIVNMCSVLKYLHADMQIVHRDLNPANIMIDNQFNVKLADFGLAQTLTQSIQMMNSFVGTLIYSCPEIVQNQPYSEKADIWSLGCIVYELIKLKPPFQSTNPLMLAKKIVDSDYDKLKIDDTNASQDLLNFVNLCLEKEESRRPNVTELLYTLTPHIVTQLDQLKIIQCSLNEEIISLSRKMNQKRGGFDEIENGFDQVPLVKIETTILNKIKEDPILKFLEIIKKITFISNTQTSHQNNYKKFLVDLFYNQVISNGEMNSQQLKQELSKLINGSKNQVSILNIRFDHKGGEVKQIITYQILSFYIQELYALIKQQTN